MIVVFGLFWNKDAFSACRGGGAVIFWVVYKRCDTSTHSTQIDVIDNLEALFQPCIECKLELNELRLKNSK